MIIKSYQVAALRTEFSSFRLLFFFLVKKRFKKKKKNRKKEQKKEKVLNYLRPCVRSDEIMAAPAGIRSSLTANFDIIHNNDEIKQKQECPNSPWPSYSDSKEVSVIKIIK